MSDETQAIYGDLCDYNTGDVIRPATAIEAEESSTQSGDAGPETMTVSIRDKFLADNDMTATPPAPCEFFVGASVYLTNNYGVKFGPYEVIGYAKAIEWRRFIHLDSDCPWFPVRPDQLSWA